MTRTAIREALEWNATDIDDARDALKEAKADLAAAKAKRVELRAKLAAMRSTLAPAFPAILD
jgi:multidrug resistance efflux pump